MTFSSQVLHCLCGVGECCRFTPTCSAYAKEAFENFSIPQASRLTLSRIARCHPWGTFGEDPVPQKVRRS